MEVSVQGAECLQVVGEIFQSFNDISYFGVNHRVQDLGILLPQAEKEQGIHIAQS